VVFPPPPPPPQEEGGVLQDDSNNLNLPPMLSDNVGVVGLLFLYIFIMYC
jgi:hypothetical protein